MARGQVKVFVGMGGNFALATPDTPYTFAALQKCELTVQVSTKLNRSHLVHGRQALIYAYWGHRPSTPDSVFATYRLRFGIESSYRQLHEGRIRTTTRRPEVRLLYVGIALVLRNLWVWLHYTVLAERHRGGRQLQLGLLPFAALLVWAPFSMVLPWISTLPPLGTLIR